MTPGATSPWRLKGTGRPGRAVPTLKPGPPSERAVAVYTRLVGLGRPPRGRWRRHPEITLPLAAVAGWVGCPPRTTKRRLAELRAHGWIVTGRELVAGGRGGSIHGHLRVELVWPVDLHPGWPDRGATFKREV